MGRDIAFNRYITITWIFTLFISNSLKQVAGVRSRFLAGRSVVFGYLFLTVDAVTFSLASAAVQNSGQQNCGIWKYCISAVLLTLF